MSPAPPLFYQADFSGFLLFVLFLAAGIGGSFLYNHIRHEQAKAINSDLSSSNPHPLFGSDDLEVKITRRQRKGFGGMNFYIEFRTYVPPDQLELIRKYNLYPHMLYQSDDVDHYAEKASKTMTQMPSISNTILGLGSTKNLGQKLASDVVSVGVLAKAATYRSLSGLAMRLTVHDMIMGKTISSKDPDELIAIEAVVLEAAKAMKELIARSETFTDNIEVKHI